MINMSAVEHISLLDTLKTAEFLELQVDTLRAIKNNITGHELRKVECIRRGLIPVLARILQLPQAGTTSSAASEAQVDKLWLHATNIVGSLAYGGPSLVQPVLQSTIIPSLIAQLAIVSAPRLALSILRCLNVVADNLPLSSPDDWTTDRRLATWLYNSNPLLIRLSQFIEHAHLSITTQQMCDATLALICKTCVENVQKQALFRAGLLSALSNRLASFIVAEGLVIPGIEAHGVDTQERGPVPQPAPSNARLCPVLETLAVLVESSKQYASDLINSPSILTVLPSTHDDFSPADLRKSPWGSTYFSGAAVPRAKTQTLLDLLLPNVPDSEKPGPTDSFPPLGANVFLPKRRSSTLRPGSETSTGTVVEGNNEAQDECLLVPWLLYIVREYRGRRRVLASRLLVHILKHGLINSTRSRSLKVLMVPLLVQSLDQKLAEDDENALLLTKISYKEIIPCVLAKLIMDDELAQKIAVDSKAIVKLAGCLKTTFEPSTERASLWRPWKQAIVTQGESTDYCLGPGGPSLRERHTMLYREGLLQALAAIAPFNDHYRKEICDQGVLVQIMLALEPFHSETSTKEGENPSMITSGNSASTLLAACDAVRALTRSVTALRTKLVDAEIGKAIIKLLHSTDPEVAIAATKVIANLAIDFSPMKPAISEPALVKKLCEQAHSANARLRLESIWALKHLVLNSSNKLKRDVIDELGTSWIQCLISTDPYDITPGDVIGLVQKDYLPRSAHYAESGDVVMSEHSDDEEVVTTDVVNAEAEYTKHTVEDDLAIQEQLLELLRNLFCGDNAPEIVEYILGQIGYPEFIRIIMDRLRSRTTYTTIRKVGQNSSSPPGIIIATLNILVHLASCQPKFRNIIAENGPLLKQILTFALHSNRHIRAAVCWVAINLTYGDNPVEREACRRRAYEMNKAGFIACMRRMENDSELDVRERAKTAVSLLDKLVPKELQR